MISCITQPEAKYHLPKAPPWGEHWYQVSGSKEAMVPQAGLVGQNTGKPGQLLLHTGAWPWRQTTSHSSHHCFPLWKQEDWLLKAVLPVEQWDPMWHPMWTAPCSHYTQQQLFHMEILLSCTLSLCETEILASLSPLNSKILSLHRQEWTSNAQKKASPSVHAVFQFHFSNFPLKMALETSSHIFIPWKMALKLYVYKEV